MTAISAESLVETVHEAVGQALPSPAMPIGHRVPFHWPPHLLSGDYHIAPHDWSGRASFEDQGEVFAVELAHNSAGVFGRTVGLWNEAKGETAEEVVELLKAGAQPLLNRQRAAAEALGLDSRLTQAIAELGPDQWIRLMLCRDRDVAHDAMTLIEAHASEVPFGPGLIALLRDRKHPFRRVAHWCVLDMFEDLPSLCPTPELQSEAVQAIRDLVWDAEDDYGRAVYKAGVVLGGHICTPEAAEALFECVSAPSKIGRRSALHALFHVAEWMPDLRERVIETLRTASESDPELLLRHYAGCMAADVEAGGTEHVAEPLFEEEL
ncbi:MAG: hypothetical protein AB7F50_00530 [Fimbriimonadaceae bacterium]